MPKAITGDRLRAAVEEQTFIKDGLVTSAEGVKYDFRMGTKILKAAFGQPLDMKNLPEAERTKMAVEPGEVVFVVTEERLDLPRNIMAVLSPKRKLSHQGVHVLGGLCIDPLYRGKLWIGLQNVSSTPFPLIPGKKLIAAVFYELEADETGQFPIPESPVDDFPEELVRLIQNYKPVAFQGLQDALAETQRQLMDLRNEITSGREWQHQFREALQSHSNQIEKLLEGLREEKDNRVATQKDFDNRLRELQKEVYKQAARLGAIIGGIVILAGLISQFLWPKLFGH